VSVFFFSVVIPARGFGTILSANGAKPSACYATRTDAERATKDEPRLDGSTFWIFLVDAQGCAI